MRTVPVRARDGVDLDALRALADELSRHATLQDVLEWCAARTPRLDLADVVVHDELTHDVVVSVTPTLHLVYDTT